MKKKSRVNENQNTKGETDKIKRKNTGSREKYKGRKCFWYSKCKNLEFRLSE